MSAAYAAYSEAMGKAGVVLGGNRLRPTAEATTVRVKGGKTEVLDGPYADTKEQLGGYYLIDVPDLDAALSWAARCPSAVERHDRGPPDLADAVDAVTAARRRRRRAPPKRSRAAATASWSPFSRRARATSRRRRTRCPTPSRPRSPTGRRAAFRDSPEAWLLAVARRKTIDAARRRRSATKARRPAAR